MFTLIHIVFNVNETPDVKLGRTWRMSYHPT